MEHKAHYAIVGFFAIALAIAAGLFVVWLGRIDFDQEWSRYDVVFDGPVRGLTETSEVRFNGIKVGEVTRLYLDPEDPSRVIARIRVLEEAPLKSDSLAQLEPQGLTGLSYIQVTAGSPGAPELEADGAEVPRITSRPAQLDSSIERGEDVVSEAIEALRAINSVMSPENQETLATILENLEGFSEAVSGTEDTVARLETTLAEIGEAASALEDRGIGVVPDIMNLAKALTNGAVPMGAVLTSSEIYQAFADDALPDHIIGLPHGYTYSGHPVACAAALAALEVFEQDDMVGRALRLAPLLEEALHGLKGLPHITDIRNIGMAGALQIAPRDGDMLVRPFEIGVRCYEAGLYVRWGGDTLQFAPPFTCEPEDLERMQEILRRVIGEVA